MAKDKGSREVKKPKQNKPKKGKEAVSEYSRTPEKK